MNSVAKTYERGLGGYDFSDLQIELLQAIRDDVDEVYRTENVSELARSDFESDVFADWFFSDAVDRTGEGRHLVGLGYVPYNTILGMISDEVDGALQRKDGVDYAVWRWIEGASGVNSVANFQGAYIQEYTKLQYAARYGDIDADLLVKEAQLASNEIARTVLHDIVEQQNLPDLEGIGVGDAGSAVQPSAAVTPAA